MNEDLKIVKDTDEEITLTWNTNDLANRYNVLLLDSDFNSIVYKEIETNYITIDKTKLNNIIGLKIEYLKYNEELNKSFVVGNSNTYLFAFRTQLKELIISSIKSYNGITMSFFSKELYDLYKIYEYRSDGLHLYKETEDFQICGKEIKEKNKYVIEGYKKEKDEYKLRASSGIYTCKTKKVECKLKRPKISIIVPVYNSELFIARCIDSVLLSTFTKVELLLINDGKIIEWYQEKYPTIVKVTNKENEGVAFTRNKGIDLAIGEYIAFIDNDDLVHPYFYECLYTNAKEAKADVAISKTINRNDVYDYYVYFDYQPSRKGEKYFMYNYDEIIDVSEESKPKSMYFVAIWNKIIKASIAKGKYFDKQNYYEDQAYTRMIYSYCNRFIFCYDAYYLWDRRIQKTRGTQTNRYKSKNLDELHQYNIYILKANIYGFYYGNPKRTKRLANSFLRDAYFQLKEYRELDGGRLYDAYKEEVIKMNKITNLLKNEYLKKHNDAYNMVKKMLEEK